MNIQGIIDAIMSDALSTGIFEAVNGHEPRNAPGNGLTAAVWADAIGPLRTASGLDATSALVVMNVRIYTSMFQQPYDAIDPTMMSAVDTLMTKYSGAFTLGGLIRNVDLLGMSGTTLSARAGYIDQDKKLFRTYTITLPMIVNDAWAQVA